MSILYDVAVNILSSAGVKLGKKFIQIIINRPNNVEELKEFQNSCKQILISSIRSIEFTIEELMNISLNNSNLELLRFFDTNKSSLLLIRHNIDSEPLMNNNNSTIKEKEAINLISLFYIALIHHCFNIENTITILKSKMINDPNILLNELLKDMSNNIISLEKIWNIKPKMTLTEEMMFIFQGQLYEVADELIHNLEDINLFSPNSIESIFNEVISSRK